MTSLKSRPLGVRHPTDESPTKFSDHSLYTLFKTGVKNHSLVCSPLLRPEEMLDLLKANENLMVLWTCVRGYKFPKESNTVKWQQLGQYMSLMSEWEVLYKSVSLCFLWFLLWHSDKMGTVQNQQHTVSSLTSQLHLFRDRCIFSLSHTRHRARRVPVNIYTHTRAVQAVWHSQSQGEIPFKQQSSWL